MDDLTAMDAEIMGAGLDAPDALAPAALEPAALEFDPERLMDCLARHLEQGKDAAVSLSQPEKREWAQYREMYSGDWKGDDPSDPLVKLGAYLPLAARLIRKFAEQIHLRLIPDPSTMDIFTVFNNWEGLEDYARAIEAALRQDFKRMRPDAAESFYDLLGRMLLDRGIYGSACCYVTHEAFGIDDGDGLVEGPCAQHLDPRNLWPWRVEGINQLSQTAASVYDPVSRGVLQDGEFLSVERIFREVTPEDLPDIDPEAEPEDDDRAPRELSRERYERYVHFLEFPAHAVRQEFALEDSVTDREIVAAAAAALGADPERAERVRWWEMHTIKGILTLCEPHRIDLPEGMGPLEMSCNHQVSGELWGWGFFKLIRYDERLANYFRRKAMHISGMMAEPPYTYPKDAIDKLWLQRMGYGDDAMPPLRPGMGIPVNGLYADRELVRPINYNWQALEVMWANADKSEASAREQTGATTALEGSDRSRTATQAANNLQQSMTSVDYHVARLEQGLMKNLAQRDYVVRSQAMRLHGLAVEAPLSREEGLLQTVTLHPEHMRHLSLIDIQITGSQSPVNRVQMLGALKEFAATLLPLGVVDPVKVAKLWAAMLTIRGVGDLIAAPAQDAQAVLANVVSALGPQGLAFLPPEVQAQLQGMMAPGQFWNPIAGSSPQPAPGPAGGGGMPMMGANNQGLPMMGGGNQAGPNFQPQSGM